MWFPVSQRKMQLFEERNISAGGVLVLQHPEATTAHHCQVHRAVAEEVSDLNDLIKTKDTDGHSSKVQIKIDRCRVIDTKCPPVYHLEFDLNFEVHQIARNCAEGVSDLDFGEAEVKQH